MRSTHLMSRSRSRLVLFGVLLGGCGLLAAFPFAARAQRVVAEEVASGFNSALSATSAGDGTGRIFVIEQAGVIRIWNGVQVLPTPFLDISSLVLSGGEQGLLGLAFHPEYASNGFFYVNYTDLSGDTVVARYTVSGGNPDVANPASALRVLGFDQPFSNHNGGDLHFGPDDLLYVSSGDGGAPASNGQDEANLLGKLLRLDVDGDDFPADPNRNYAIPPTNPLVGQPGAAEEIWVLGLRNPWRFSFDRANGDLFIGDVGEGAREEINHLPASLPAAGAGANFGWPCYEGSLVFDPTGCAGPGAYVFPIVELPHNAPPNNNCSVIGGLRYRGTDSHLLQGAYFYKDWCTGTLWAARPQGNTWIPRRVADLSPFNYTGFAEREDGEIFLAGGFQLLHVRQDLDAIFTNGFESGNTSAWSVREP